MEKGHESEDSLAWLDVSELARRIARGEVSPVEVVDSTLARIERLNPRLNAFLRVLDRPARRAARRAQEKVGRGSPLGPLHGVPVSAKDIILTRDAPTTAGSRIYGDGLESPTDAPVVARLRRAGAILIGKTHLHEVALGITSLNEHFGPVRNPWDLDRVPGGSSGGSAAAVAAGLGGASLGTDTRGSVRIPAACCGVSGIRPTTGLVPTEGVLPLSWTLDQVGPLARSVEDAALVLSVISGGRGLWDRYQTALTRGVRGLTLGVSEYHLRSLDPEVTAAVEDAVAALAAAGAERREVRVPELDGSLEGSYVIGGAEAVTHHDPTLRERPGAYGPAVRARLEGGYALTAIDYVRAQQKRQRVVAAFAEVFRSVDVLVGATLPTAAAPIGAEEIEVGGRRESIIDGYMRLSAPQSMGGVPAASVPCGFTSEGLPIGLQLIAAQHREDLVVAVGAELQRLTNHHRHRPPLSPKKALRAD
jgi:aspartyl-tRNA(Asn)/glutamyl-tRNA(Gln) amidotransferase subunit A